MWNAFDVFVFAAGFAASWYAKDKLTQMVTGTDAFIKKLETKAAALKAAL